MAELTTHTVTKVETFTTSNSEIRLCSPAISKARHEWMIVNFSLFWEGDGNDLSVRSSNFRGGDGEEWNVKLWPNGKRNPDCLSIDLWCIRWPSSNVKSNEKGIEVEYRFSILNDSQRPVYHSSSSLRPKIGENECQEFIPKNYLMENHSLLLPEDSLTIQCEITTHIHEAFQLPQSDVMDDWNTILQNEIFEGVIIEADGKEFPSCQGVLRVRSPVLAALIDEKPTKRLLIEDVKHEVVEEMMMYIFSDTAPNLKDMARDLLALADKYDLKRLKAMCEETLRGELTVENAVDALILADTCSAAHLKKQTINFISASRFYFPENKLRIAKDQFLEVGRPNLIDELVEGMRTSYNAAHPEEDSRSEAIFTFEKKNFSGIRRQVLSPPCMIRNLPWRILIKKTTIIPQLTSLGFFLQCNGKSKSCVWSCDASAKLVILSQKDGVNNFVREISHVFYPKAYDWGFHHFLNWNDVMDPEKGFIKNDTVIFQVHVQANVPLSVLDLVPVATSSS